MIKPSIGNTVEYIVEKEPTGIIGTVTGFWSDERGLRAKVDTRAGYQWLLPVEMLEIQVTEPVKPSQIRLLTDVACEK